VPTLAPAIQVRAWQDNGSAARQKALRAPRQTVLIVASLHQPEGSAMSLADTQHLIRPYARILQDQDEKAH
jgi:hypothetical protein